MKAVLNGAVIAEADKNDLISIEGNWYFPPSSVRDGVLEKSPTPYTCPWKGACQYYTVTAGDSVSPDAAFAYPTPFASAIDRVGKDFSGYVAFWKDVQVTD
jgi:uncharacterized protein (DUF427 family)